MNIAVFASHGGSDLQAIIDGCKSNKINATVMAVISNNADSMALQRANNENISAYHLSAKKFGSEEHKRARRMESQFLMGNRQRCVQTSNRKLERIYHRKAS